MRIGSNGADVLNLQKLLIQNGYAITADGDFGKGTDAAVRDFQEKHNLVVDGNVGPNTLNTLQGNTGLVINPSLSDAVDAGVQKVLSQQDFIRAASKLSVSVAHVHTVTDVEALQSGFISNGKPKTLFERHQFYRLLSETKGKAFANQVAQANPDICNKLSGGYLKGVSEWNRLQKAVRIDETCALKAASWGLFQIMGFNHAACGYRTVQDYVTAMCESEGKQLDAFVNYMLKNPTVLSYLRNCQWVQFARAYNGPTYYINKYDLKLAGAYRHYS